MGQPRRCRAAPDAAYTAVTPCVAFDSRVSQGATYQNTASGNYSSVTGGDNNEAAGVTSTVSGGINRTVSGTDDWRAGDLFQDS